MLLWSNCKKENEIHVKKHITSEQLHSAGAILAVCNDTTAFKSNVDLQPLEYLRGCYFYTALKAVPGLGETAWTGNCQASITDTLITFRFTTYEPYFEELYLREELSFHSVPSGIGIYPISDFENWSQNNSLGYAFCDRRVSDGDVISAVWGVDTTCTSYIEIIRLDLEDMEVEGEFEVHLKMIAQFPIGGINHSERINFFNGRFIAEIEK